MLAAMGLLFDSFWRAAAYLRPRVIALSLLPLVLMALLAMGLGYFYWDGAVQAMRTLLDASSLLASVWGWLRAGVWGCDGRHGAADGGAGCGACAGGGVAAGRWRC